MLMIALNQSFLKSRWLKGPEFIEKREMEWPKIPDDLGQIPPGDPEVRKDIIAYVTRLDEKNPISRLIEHYSSWNRLKRAVAWLSKLKKKKRLLGSVRRGKAS